jgi:hypothetical protein
MARKPAAGKRSTRGGANGASREIKLNALERRVTADADWAETAAEVQCHAGQFVAVYNKRVITFGADRDEVVRQAASQVPCHPDALALVIVPRADLWEMPH